MHKKILVSILVMLATVFRSMGVIVEHPTIATILEHIKKDDENKATVVIFDIDNTLMRPEKNVGGGHWFDYLWDDKIKKGMKSEDAFAEMVEAWNKIQPFITHIPVEHTTSDILREAQKRAAHVIALTSRFASLAELTIKQLHNCKIDFSLSGLEKKFAIDTSKTTYHYQAGIIFCSAYYDKGKALIELFNQISYRPKKVIFIDDILYNVKSVEQALQSLNVDIEFIGIRYSHLDKAPFDPQLAEIELLEIHKQLSRAA